MGKKYNINNQIDSKLVNLVTPEGMSSSPVLLSKAIELAEEESLDVVEMATEGPGGYPVCKIIDYGKMIFKDKKKKKEKKQIQHIKEIKYSLNIDTHDLNVKHKKIFKFLDKNYIVRYVLELNGRQKYMIDEALKKINTNLEEFSEIAVWKTPQVSKGKRVTISTTLNSI